MYTAMRNGAVIDRAQLVSAGRHASGRGRSHAGSAVLEWAARRPTLTSVTLSIVYLATLAGFVAVLSNSAVGTPVGMLVVGLFAVEILVYVVIAIYVVLPEQAPRFAGTAVR